MLFHKTNATTVRTTNAPDVALDVEPEPAPHKDPYHLPAVTHREPDQREPDQREPGAVCSAAVLTDVFELPVTRLPPVGYY